MCNRKCLGFQRLFVSESPFPVSQSFYKKKYVFPTLKGNSNPDTYSFTTKSEPLKFKLIMNIEQCILTY